MSTVAMVVLACDAVAASIDEQHHDDDEAVDHLSTGLRHVNDRQDAMPRVFIESSVNHLGKVSTRRRSRGTGLAMIKCQAYADAVALGLDR